MSSAERTRLNAFAETPLDRCGEYRANADWMAAQCALPAARWLAFDSEGRAPVQDNRLCLLASGNFESDAPANFLGCLDCAPLYALREPVAQAIFPGAT
ncbi:MAG TPA: hypothetical protein VJQ42_03795, partial [Rhodanobacteraceae bacterium]|nr:hypothetical protein [Rhodanobacteraceae bacterium]